MKSEAVEIAIKGVVPTSSGSALFLCSETKTFIIYVDISIGNAISMTLNGIKKERPLTHDLLSSMFIALGVTVEKVIITDVRDTVFFARLFLKMQNELGTKLIELDARPSDAILIALQAQRPIFAAQKVIDTVDDMTEILERLLKQQE